MLRIFILVLLLSACGLDSKLGADDSSGVSNAAQSKPNILLIVADDMGYSDVGAFGGEISTPNLDNLAARGMVLSNFHTGPTCSVSRSMLMSGEDNHIAGLGNMAETVADNQYGRPGYEGHLNSQVKTIAELLQPLGYHTYMAGKWHLGMRSELSPKSRGFEQSFALLYGGGSHFADMAGPDMHRNPAIYRNNGRLIDELPEDFYSTTFYTDKLIAQIDRNIDDSQPFFAYLAYTAPHWPLQAPDAMIDKYRGRYDQGYDAVREARFAAQKKRGLFAPSIPAPPRPANIKPWIELSVEEQRFHARNMEIYAAMVDYMDMSIGRVIDYLSNRGELNNTVIVFISDNGAEYWDYAHSPPPIGKFAHTFDNLPENIGRKGSFVFYGEEWGHVSNTPFTRPKGTPYEGGVRTPAIIYWPGRTPEGKTSSALTFITDWYATFAELAGASNIDTAGKNLVPLLTGSVEHVRDTDEAIGLEIWGRRGIISNGLKLVGSGKPNELVDWELYDLRSDPSEQNNLAGQQPRLFDGMLQKWREYVLTNNVILPEGAFTVRAPEERPAD